MSKKRSIRISTIGAQLSTIISVSLVLLIIGIILMITSLTSGAGDNVRRNMSVVLSIVPDASQPAVDSLTARLSTAPYTAELTYTTAEDVLKEEMQYNADIINVLGQNPYLSEFDIKLVPQYVVGDSIDLIISDLMSDPIVDDAYSQSAAVESLNTMLHKTALLLAVIGVIVMVVAIVLLFNTVNLSIYSRRFIIHTMQLVGATRGFIRRPFVLSGCYIGLVSGLIASVMVCIVHYYLMNIDVEMLYTLYWGYTAAVCAVLVLTGVVGCAAAAGFAASRYLNATYDALHK